MWVVLNEECYEVCKSIIPFLVTSKRIKTSQQIIKHYLKEETNEVEKSNKVN